MAPVVYRFGPFSLDTTSYRLLRGGLEVPLSPKHVEALLYFVTRPAALVTKEQLIKQLWPDVIVTDNALTQAISELRHALGDSASSPVYIQTVARRGYRFVARVETADAAVVPAGTAVASMPSTAAAPPASPGAAASAPVSVAVLDFVNVTGDPELAWLSAGIAETVTNDLAVLPTFTVIDRTKVTEAVRRRGSDVKAIAADLHVDCAVLGSFQRAANDVRITARLVTVSTGATSAEAKIDGPLARIFDLQDAIVRHLGDAMGVERPPAPRRARETSRLEAYRAVTEGRVQLESLQRGEVPQAIERFRRAIELDPTYTAAYIGLANGHLWLHESSRYRLECDPRLLETAIEHARCAVALDPEHAEAYGTLALALAMAGRSPDACEAARRATTLEPHNWAHHFRLGLASWGEDRLRSLRTCLALYPQIPLAHFLIAMVHVARNRLELANQAVREGIMLQDSAAQRDPRFPASGLHLVFGLLSLARGDARAARSAFDRELERARGGIYGTEASIGALNGYGFVFLAEREPAKAVERFRQALKLYDRQARARVGLALAYAASKKPVEAERELANARTAADLLAPAGRDAEAAIIRAAERAAAGDVAAATSSLSRLAAKAPPGPTGWMLPIDPLFASLRENAEFKAVLGQLAARAA